MSAEITYPIDFDVPVDDEERSRGLAALGVLLFAKTLLIVPHLFLLLLYFFVVQVVVVWIGYWYILIQGGKPYWVENLEIIFLAWASRVFAWFTSTTDVYPTFGADDAYPTRVTVEEAPEPQNRWLAAAGIVLIRPVMALPHLFILAWLTLGTLVAAWFGYVVILMQGRLPLALHWYFVGFHRWWARVWGWIAALTDEYPPFRFRS